MSLITRCPACQTMFKVVPDQLRISEGWVRCGKCEEIFDASAHMQEAGVQETGAPFVPEPSAPPFEGALATAIAANAGKPLASQAVAQPPDHELADGPDIDLHRFQGATAAGPAGRTEPGFASEMAPAPSRAATTLAAAELSFMRAADRASHWQRPLVRANLLVACLLLMLVLALQVLVQERDRIAAVEPGLRPLIEEVCLLLVCEIEPLRQIESVVIDSSAFSKVKGDLYRLSLTLKNNAPFDLAMPAVELALTDTLDHALMRRVFQPEELGVPSGLIPASSETQSTLVLTIKANGSGERVAGYRLLAFYP